MKRAFFALAAGFAAVMAFAQYVPPLGAGGGAMTQITKTVLAAPAASFTFASIPSTYQSLFITLDGASSTAATLDVVYLRFNGDNAGNYNYQQMFATGNAVTASAFSAVATANNQCGEVAAASGVATESTFLTVMVPNYAASTFRKHANCTAGNEGADTVGSINTWQTFITWKSTAAITQVTLLLASGANFVTGSTAILYGVN